ncbi:MAG: hypothetical protein WDM77_16110 [Steroidobacteraceae bacterium]
MKHIAAAMVGVLTLILAPLSQAAPTWTEGKNFDVLSPAQRTNVPAGKVEVMEVFSYGCIACNGFQPVMAALEHSLPSNAQMVFLPASFLAQEDWPMLQRAYFTAQALGISRAYSSGHIRCGLEDRGTGDHRSGDPSPEEPAAFDRGRRQML